MSSLGCNRTLRVGRMAWPAKSTAIGSQHINHLSQISFHDKLQALSIYSKCTNWRGRIYIKAIIEHSKNEWKVTFMLLSMCADAQADEFFVSNRKHQLKISAQILKFTFSKRSRQKLKTRKNMLIIQVHCELITPLSRRMRYNHC